jgi:hypothetical protein
MDPMDDAASTANDGADAFLRLDRAARQAGASMAAALALGQSEGRKLDDVLRGIGSRLAQSAVQSAGRGLAVSLGSTLSSTLTGGVSSLAGSFSSGGTGGVSAMRREASKPVAVSMTINTPDAESFLKSEAQVSAALARAVQRGQRAL